MPAEKIESVILSAAPYRETSCILRLFTKERGLIHGIAKGIRKAGKVSIPLDRGILLGSLLYHRPGRELHTLGSLHVVNFFPRIRAGLTKTAVRDIALELYLKTITQADHPHPELYELMVDFLGTMDESSQEDILFPMLWKFIYTYCMIEGFGIDEKSCAVLGMDDRITRFIIGHSGDINDHHPNSGDCLYVTEKLLGYCQTHFDIRAPFKSLEFVKSIT